MFDRPLIIAEIGSVHDGSFGNALHLIKAAAECGADVVKFQTHIAEAETLRDAPMPPYFKGEPRFEYFTRTGFTERQWRDLRDACHTNKVLFSSSPFSLEAVDLLERIGLDLYKVPSGEVTNTPLLEKIASTGKPVLLSTGMSDWNEIDEAVGVLRYGGVLCVMQCTSQYPTPPDKVGLNVISEIRERYGCISGYSDHTRGSAASFAAAALGARVVEKHFAFSRLMYGSDASNSMEPAEFQEFCLGLKDIWTMLDNPVHKNDLSDLQEMKTIFQKSIVAARRIEKGHVITEQDLAFKKPGDGIPAASYRVILGRRASKTIPEDTKLTENDYS